MTTAKTMAAEALFPMLSVFHSISGQPLQAVWQIYTQGSLDRLVLDFAQTSLTVIADENDDSLDLKVAATTDPRSLGAVDVSDLGPWQLFIGQPFGWGWLTLNQQGYCDGALLSWGGIVPQIVLNVRASSIHAESIEVSRHVIRSNHVE